MLTGDKALTLIDLIYNAAANPERWPAFLQTFADTVDGTETLLLFYDWSARGSNVAAIGVRFDPTYLRAYSEHYNRLNPWMKSFKTRLNCAGLPSVQTSDEFVPLADLEKTEFYNDYLLPQDTVHQMGCFMDKTEHTGCAFTCLRPRKSGAFGRTEVELLGLLLPHLQRAVGFQRRISRLEGRQRASLDALDRLTTGVIFLDDHGTILDMNAAAERILGQNDGLRTDRQVLVGSTSTETAKLRSSVASAARAMREICSAGGPFQLERPSGKRPFSVGITPVSIRTFGPDGRSAAVIVFIDDPEIKVATPPELLARTYGLTAAESRLAGLLMQGESLVDAAEQLGVTHNTVRTHLQRIYQKTNTAHQGDLVRVLLAGSRSS